jgi:hypothetical protein
MSACWLAYISLNARKQSDLAAGYLERCLALAGPAGDELRDTLMLEASAFQILASITRGQIYPLRAALCRALGARS